MEKKAIDFEQEMFFIISEQGTAQAAVNCIDIAIKYAKIKCREQRAICQDIHNVSDAIVGNVFRNAPEPNLK